ncbi:MAG: helix-turn-helix transcriptional regulator, partial [Lachnospiraceae bacterium]|nr:helix-turn-helix transcriptional regulator [Candidatus Colinaster scatohippi]
MNNITDNTNPFESYSQKQIREEIKLAKQYFETHYSEDISIEAYASSRGMSACWFRRNFRNIEMISPLQYLINLRLRRAMDLLKTSDYSIGEISNMVGYND